MKWHLTPFGQNMIVCPGDCRDARLFFGNTDRFGQTVYNGDGDGIIEATYATLSNGNYDSGNALWDSFGGNVSETGGVFQELSQAGMIAFTPKCPNCRAIGTSHPKVEMNPTEGLYIAGSYLFQLASSPSINGARKGNNAIWFIDCNPSTALYLSQWYPSCAIFRASDLQAMDIKIDDGKPLSGNLVGFGNVSAPNSCLISSSGVYSYDLSRQTLQCQAAYVIN